SNELIKQAGYQIGNIDSTVCLELPKLKPHVSQMQKIISNILSIQANAVSIKATTSEKMGFVGREEGIAAYATVLLTAI
ncbi:MAG: 2-C-methyl-D-erythritol 2,4-cyclodiphosphate synthase, partial [Ginsengibacter sp.]